jgi:hypothetical protein
VIDHARNGQPSDDEILQRIESLTKIFPVDDDRGHRWYPIEDGKTLVHCRGVTGVLGYAYPKDAGLLNWIAEKGAEGERYRDERARFGGAVHRATEELDRGEVLRTKDMTREMAKALMSYVHFHEDHRPEILAVERTVFDTRDRVAGTLDRIVAMGDNLHVLDVKNTKAIYPTHHLQVQVYARLCRVMGVPITHTSILRLGSKHKRGYELATEEYDESAYEQDFLACLHLWERAHPKHEAPYVEQLPSELSLAHIASLPLPEEKNGKSHANGRK